MIGHPLRLATGSHTAGSGKGCAMNVVSWENGDTTITDLPACADPMLAMVVQRVNDSQCTHTDDGLLCPACSVLVLDLAHRTVGTGGILSGTPLHVVWVRVACELARTVAHLNTDPRVLAAIEAAERWADDPSANADIEDANAAANAANAADNAADNAAATAAAAANAAAYAAYAAYAANAAYAADNAAATAAANAAAYAANAANAAAYAASRLKYAHLALDIFQRLTGHTEQSVEAPVVAAAVERMLAVAR